MHTHNDIISAIALILASKEDHESQMVKVLAEAGQGIGLSRCCIIVYGQDTCGPHRAHEWCADAIPFRLDSRRIYPYVDSPEWKCLLESGELSFIDDTASLSAPLNAIIEGEVKAFSVVPLVKNGKVSGFIQFDICNRTHRWTDAEKATILSVARLIRMAFSHEMLTQQLAESEENFKNFFHTMDDIIVIGNQSGSVIYANKGACSKLGYTLEEIIGVHILNLHPEDKRAEASEILQSMFRGERISCPLQLRTRQGGRIPVETRIWFGIWDGEKSIFGVSKDLSAEQAALQKFERLFNNNPAAMAISRIEDRVFLDVNEAFLNIFGYTKGEIIGRSGGDLSLFVSDERWDSARDELLSGGFIRDCHLALRKKDGSIIHGLFSGEIIQSQGEEYFLTVMVDITKQYKLQSDLESERRRLENIIWGTGLGTWEWNVQTGETVFNEQWAAIIGYTFEELSPVSIQTWTSLAHPDDLVESEKKLGDHFSGKTDSYDHEIRMRHKDGRWIWVHDKGKVLERDENGAPLWVYGTHADITIQKEMQERIQNLAIRDPLTDVFNRRYFFSRMESVLAECSRGKTVASIALLDIDHFKAINDTLGHLAGDAVLKQFTGIVMSMVRSYDLVGRYGGEEFIILAQNTRKEELLKVVNRILDKVRSEVFRHGSSEIQATFSAGIVDSAEFTAETTNTESVLALVDSRLYKAKSLNRNCCVWD